MSLKLPLGRCYLRVVDRNKPVRLSTVLLLRKLSAGTDSLVPDTTSDDIRAIRHAGLRQRLDRETIGRWSVCVDTINFLEQEVKKYRPRVILEFGSGLSTLCLAQFMQDIHGGTDRTYVCSVEQNASDAATTLGRLSDAGLHRNVRIVTAPLVKTKIEGHEIQCYDIREEDLSGIAQLRPEFILVDGPSAPGLARFGTVPLVKHALAPDSHIYLDDAFRDCELEIAKSWQSVLRMDLDGVLPTKKGLLVGHLR
jgi:hypothetical protein